MGCGQSSSGGKSRPSEVKTNNVKLLLLGSGGVGKSTIFKQMRILYASGFTDQDRHWAKGCITENILEVLEDLDALTEDLDIDLLPDNEELMDEIKPALLEFRGRDVNAPPPAITVWGAVEKLWADPGIQKAYKTAKSRSVGSNSMGAESNNLIDWASYFLAKIDELKQPDFVPTDNDILRLRRATTDSDRIEYDMQVKNMVGKSSPLHVSCTDVGGQAHEQAEWSKHAANLSAILYVANSSAYNIAQQDGLNMLKAQIKLLETVCKTPGFTEAIVIVLLNKIDLLEERLQTVKVADFFEDYDDDNSLDSVKDFFANKFKAVRNDGQNINVIETTATNTKLMEEVLASVGQAVMQKTLADAKYFG